MTEYTGLENIANSVPIIVTSDFLMGCRGPDLFPI